MINPKVDFHDIYSEIYYLTKKEGGRLTPVFDGYRGQFYYDGRDWDATQEFQDKEVCCPGEKVKVAHQFTSISRHKGQLHVGKRFFIREGSRTVGRGVITAVNNEDLLLWDIRAEANQLRFNGYSEYSSNDKHLLKLFAQATESSKLFSFKGLEKAEGTGADFKATYQLAVEGLILGQSVWPLRELLHSTISLGEFISTVSYFKSSYSLSFLTWSRDRHYLCGEVVVEYPDQVL